MEFCPWITSKDCQILFSTTTAFISFFVGEKSIATYASVSYQGTKTTGSIRETHLKIVRVA